ncbi:class I SAM-dependent methyltransferase [Mitsuaria sp. GD03876]|uniref:class I SAM-dependent methyltransferase n=1 Tax=Mitsuaria sp. GD03876 TaxID=2975399 RepID=UPI0024474D96|nr:class I SAM-dependent methyltransferase [Mitsuaria sp. GD03876]MDH0864456.1 class I SAM-dependent methyltransferase [Mitsuaria sp. GD03876]
MSLLDVPSPIDLRQMADARQWADEAMVKRPWRTEFFETFAQTLDAGNAHHVLELGSGPGFLAHYLLGALPEIDYVALDFSSAMHQLAAERLGPAASRVRFVERSFREPDWVEGLGPFDHVVTNQAVHELRHKRHARALHEQVRGLLKPGGRYLVCDHFAGDGGMKNDQLYMSIEEQRLALAEAGFTRVEPLLLKRGLLLYVASVASAASMAE